jgi:predicted AlkP superfamily pyrophosphatase or phosphodiesterase
MQPGEACKKRIKFLKATDDSVLMDILVPDYMGGSIVNLMSSIGSAMGAKSIYPDLRLLPKKEVSECKSVILLVIDGLGFDFLNKHGQGSTLLNNLRGSMTTVCPPTTAAAITTFHTGVAPQQHAATGWFVHFKELGGEGIPLRFCPRQGGMHYSQLGLSVGDLFYNKPLFRRLDRKVYCMSHHDFAFSDYNRFYNNKAKMHTYRTLRQFFGSIASLTKARGKKFIYAYWPDFDAYSHRSGSESRKAIKHFREIDRAFAELTKKIKDSIVIVTSDHGFMDIPAKNMIYIDKHPVIQDSLVLPLAGETRFAYAYVRPGKVQRFEQYMKNNFKGRLELYKSEDLVKRGLFGIGKPDRRFLERVGDYIIVANPGFCIRDRLLKQKHKRFVGFHGGLSRDEMLVPLIVIKK